MDYIEIFYRFDPIDPNASVLSLISSNCYPGNLAGSPPGPSPLAYTKVVKGSVVPNNNLQGQNINPFYRTQPTNTSFFKIVVPLQSMLEM